jgi:hypothetical protein
MIGIVWGPPAPEGQQGPPTCAPAHHEGALRVTRGSLPLTSGTACRREEKDHEDDVRRLDAGREH